MIRHTAGGNRLEQHGEPHEAPVPSHFNMGGEECDCRVARLVRGISAADSVFECPVCGRTGGESWPVAAHPWPRESLGADLETAAWAWDNVGRHDTPNDSWERGYRAALRACAERAREILEDHAP